MSRLYIVTLLIQLICRVYHEKRWAAARSVFLGGGDARAGGRLESTLKTQCLAS